MKTCTYQQVVNLAAELAGRTRDNLPTSEATMLLTFAAAELPDLWNREAWPELCDHLESVPVVGGFFDTRVPIELPATTSLWVTVSGLFVGQTYTVTLGNAIYVTDLNGSTEEANLVLAENGSFVATQTEYYLNFPTAGAALTTTITAGDEMGEILTLHTGDPRVSTQTTQLFNWTELDGRVHVTQPAPVSGTVWVEWQTPAPDLLAVASSDLADTRLPVRFKLPLAYMMASHLLGSASLESGEAQALAGPSYLVKLADQELLKDAAKLRRPWWRNGRKEF